MVYGLWFINHHIISPIPLLLNLNISLLRVWYLPRQSCRTIGNFWIWQWWLQWYFGKSSWCLELLCLGRSCKKRSQSCFAIHKSLDQMRGKQIGILKSHRWSWSTANHIFLHSSLTFLMIGGCSSTVGCEDGLAASDRKPAGPREKTKETKLTLFSFPDAHHGNPVLLPHHVWRGRHPHLLPHPHAPRCQWGLSAAYLTMALTTVFL